MKTPKYRYPAPFQLKNRQWPDRILTAVPRYCSVDLRDGNQALPVPMNVQTKIEFFKMLCDIGFKEIEVGFPSASQDDFDFVRALIEQDLVPQDVTLSVLTQARRSLIERTVESLAGCRHALLHLYVATSDLHTELVFGKDRQGVMQMAVEGTQMVRDYLQKAGLLGKIDFEFSPEEFTDSDPDFVISLCEAVRENWPEATRETFILNLPATVERRPANQYADMIEYFCTHYRYMDSTCVSLHAHNDQGCAVAATELALLAGATRVEGTLFGHGERTGNVDLVTLSLNLYSRGLENPLNFRNLPSIVKRVEEISKIEVHPRHPYAGELVFTAFSGSHQDAIRKGLDALPAAEKRFGQRWKVPYLHIDPSDVGRVYEKLIRINSQSGKGGVAYVLESEFGIHAPKGMHPQIGLEVQHYAEMVGREVTSNELYDIFRKAFVNATQPYEFIALIRRVDQLHPEKIGVSIRARLCGRDCELSGWGNGPISAAAAALRGAPGMISFEIEDFAEHTLGKTSEAMALAYISVCNPEKPNNIVYGCGEAVNIDRASVKALFAALNRLVRIEEHE